MKVRGIIDYFCCIIARHLPNSACHAQGVA